MFRRRRGAATTAAAATQGADAEMEQWVAGLPPQWAPPVRSAMASRARFRSLLSSSRPGPTREWLEGLSPTMDDAVRRVAEAVWRAMNAAEMVQGLSGPDAADALKQARRNLDDARRSGTGVEDAEERVRVMSERHRAVNDALNLAESAHSGLGELNVRLETAVARATTIVLRSSLEGADELDREFESVIVGLTALDDALGELGS